MRLFPSDLLWVSYIEENETCCTVSVLWFTESHLSILVSIFHCRYSRSFLPLRTIEALRILQAAMKSNSWRRRAINQTSEGAEIRASLVWVIFWVVLKCFFFMCNLRALFYINVFNVVNVKNSKSGIQRVKLFNGRRKGRGISGGIAMATALSDLWRSCNPAGRWETLLGQWVTRKPSLSIW